MKVPKYIEEKIGHAQKYNLESVRLQNEIMGWFLSKGIDFDDNPTGIESQFVDVLQGASVSGFVKSIEDIKRN